MTPDQIRETQINAAIPQAEHQRMAGLGRYEQMQIRAAGILAYEERRWTMPGCHGALMDRYSFWSGVSWVCAFLQAYGFDLSHEALERVVKNHQLTQGLPVARTFDDCRAILDFEGDPGTAPGA